MGKFWDFCTFSLVDDYKLLICNEFFQLFVQQSRMAQSFGQEILILLLKLFTIARFHSKISPITTGLLP
jgi:hypothetical protein